MTISSNVCVVGSGVAGAIVSDELLKAGVKDLLMIEAGPRIEMRNQRSWHDHAMSNLMILGTGYDPLSSGNYRPTDYENKGSKEFNMPYVRARGGSTLRWGGQSFRLKPEDFRLKTNTGRGIDWPISYADLEPYYAIAERTIQVAG